jgi:acetyl esterase/lipase
MSDSFKDRVHPDFHPMLKFPAPDFDSPWQVKFLRIYARLNSYFTRTPYWISLKTISVTGKHTPVKITYFQNNQINGLRPVIIFYHGGSFVIPAVGLHKTLLFE